MNFNLTENQRMIQEMTRDFAKQRVLPYRNEWDDKEHFPIDILKEAGELGLLGVLVPEEYGKRYGVLGVCECIDGVR